MTEELRQKVEKAKGTRVATERESKCVAFGYTSAVYQIAEDLLHTMLSKADEIDDIAYAYQKICLGEALNCATMLYHIGIISLVEYEDFIDALYGYDVENDAFAGKPDAEKLIQLTDKVSKNLEEF